MKKKTVAIAKKNLQGFTKGFTSLFCCSAKYLRPAHRFYLTTCCTQAPDVLSTPGRARPPRPGPISLAVTLCPTPLSCKAHSPDTVSPSLIRTPEPTPKGSSDLTNEITVESPEPVLRCPCSAGQSFWCCQSSGSRQTFHGRQRPPRPAPCVRAAVS